MKKFFTLSLCSLLFSAAAMAEEPNITLLEGGASYGGFMPECISANGQYVGGSTFMQALFMSEWEQQNTFVAIEGSKFDNMGAEIRSITNDGLGVGFDDNGALTVNFANQEITYLTKVSKDLISDAVCDGVSADGSIAVGYIYPKGGAATAAYWENGTPNILPLPTPEEIGFYYEGSRALLISDDAQTIVGFVVDKLSTKPMVIWHRQADGSYVCDPVCKNYFCLPTELNNEFIRFTPKSLSHNGKLVLMQVSYTTAEEWDNVHLAYYDIEKDELNISPVSIPTASFIDSMLHSISDNGTSVGYFETEEGRKSFIMYASDMQPRLLSEEYPLPAFELFTENGENAVSGISADGRYISGMGTDYSTAFNTYYFVGYVLDRGVEDEESGVEAIDTDNAINEITEIYTIDGIKVSEPVKGINIIRSSDGKVKKVLY